MSLASEIETDYYDKTESYINFSGYVSNKMDIYKFIWTRLQAKLFRLLCLKVGQPMNMRELAKLLKASPTAVSNSLTVFCKDELVMIKKSKTINLTMVELNRNNSKAIELKRSENLRMIYESGLSEYLYELFPGASIVLFGSYSRGEDIIANEVGELCSDIDIAIIGIKDKEVNTVNFEKKLERKISLNFYGSWNEIHKNLRENILNGIILSGSVEL